MAEDGLLFSLRKKSLFFIWPRDLRGRVPAISPEQCVVCFREVMLAAVGAVYWAALKDEEEFTGREKQHLGTRNCKLKGKEI